MEKQQRYKNDNNELDLIDDWAIKYKDSPEIFRALMFEMQNKYQKRYGKKDSFVSESRKIADYANRLYLQELKWEEENEKQRKETKINKL